MNYDKYPNTLTEEEVWDAAGFIISALKESGRIDCCLIGGTALFLHGVEEREIKDLDFVVFLREKHCDKCIHRQCCLYSRISQAYPDRLKLVDSVKSNAPYSILMYEAPETKNTIKIDLLVPAEEAVEIPPGLTVDHVVYIDGWPVAPLEFLLYHKLLGWSKRIESFKKNKRKAVTTDTGDIYNLCELLHSNGIDPLEAPFRSVKYNVRPRLRAKQFVEYNGEDAGYYLGLVGLPGY
ncbi:hypothetical protein FRC17_002999 [Serendipita sp. 399]|nr:hypothetical protein FRC17_002999 [Serendipita sp. 399]